MDLNLYPVFLEIMRHGSVSKAAETLGLTQPATSNALSRLRDHLDDPLFVRTRTGMLPTHFAKEILPTIERAIAALDGITEETGEDLPKISTLKKHFKIVMSDLEETLFLPDLTQSLSADAPGISLEVRQYRREILQTDLEAGNTDFVLAHLNSPFNNIVSQTLASQEFACLARKNHPGLKQGLSLEEFTQLGHILVVPDQGGRRGMVDTRLHKMGKKRHMACSVPHFLSACVLASRSNYLLTVPRRLGEKISRELSLNIYDLPFDMPGFTIGLHWHWTRERDQEHAAFRHYLLQLFG